VSNPLALVSNPLALVSSPLALVSRPLALVSNPLALVSNPLALVSRAPTPVVIWPGETARFLPKLETLISDMDLPVASLIFAF
jgi:hypothetical protein